MESLLKRIGLRIDLVRSSRSSLKPTWRVLDSKKFKHAPTYPYSDDKQSKQSKASKQQRQRIVQAFGKQDWLSLPVSDINHCTWAAACATHAWAMGAQIQYFFQNHKMRWEDNKAKQTESNKANKQQNKNNNRKNTAPFKRAGIQAACLTCACFASYKFSFLPLSVRETVQVCCKPATCHQWSHGRPARLRVHTLVLCVRYGWLAFICCN